MPDALIVIRNDFNGAEAIKEMVKIGLVKCVSVKGVKVYGRHYMTTRAVREAYHKKKGKKK